MIKVSVIIPIYNTEKYLKKCLDSVCNQTLKDIEIICINDCSTDNSLKILEEYAKVDNRIKIINFEKNKGVAIARNTGIKASRGEYIAFVDSDDYIELDFLEKLYSNSKHGEADIVKGGDLRVLIGDQIEIWTQNDAIRQNKYNFWSQFSTAIYKSNLDLLFSEALKVCEDITFLLQTVHKSQNIVIVDDAFYYYVKHDNSLDTAKYSNEKLDSFIEYVNITMEFLDKNNLSPNEKKIILSRLIAQIDLTKKYRLEENSNPTELNLLYKKVVIKKMRG